LTKILQQLMSGSRIALTIKFLRAATNPPDCGFDYQTITKLFILDLSPMGERTRGQDVEMSRDGEKAKVLKGIRPLGRGMCVRSVSRLSR
jgi:hypothetical protein